jgi:putative spermidine/putrescine transport system ATP-binding protein
VRLGGPILAVVQESTFLGSIRRTLVRTEGDVLLRMQHPVSERLEFGERVGVGIAPEPVAVRAR